MAKTQQNKNSKQPGGKSTISTKNADAANGKRIKWLLAILLLAFIALTPVLQSEFINYDDDVYVTENPLIQRLDIAGLFSGFYMNQYSPLAMGIMGLEFKISSNPVFIKTASVLLHLLITCLLFKLLSLLFNRAEYILIPTALFALHPMQVESVAWTAASMKIGSYALFFIASLICYVQYLQKKQIGYLCLSLLLFLFSCFSKEQAIALTILIFSIDYFKGRSFGDKKVWLEKIPFLAVAILFGIITLKASSSSGESQSTVLSYSLASRLLISNFSVFAYIGKMLVPMQLSAFVTYPLPNEINAAYYISLAGLPVLLYTLYSALKKNNKILVFGIVFFLVNIGLPILSQLMGARDVMMADRYVYLPLVGFSIMLVVLLIYLKEKLNIASPLFYGVCIGYALILSACSFSRATVWHDSVSLFTDVIEKGNKDGKYTPFLSLPFNNRGIALKKQGDYDAALQDYNTAAQINPADPKSYANRGNIYFDKQDPKKAILDYNKSLAISPTQAIVLSSRGAAYGMLGKLDSAILDLTRSIELEPFSRNTYMNRSLAYYNTGKFNEALKDITRHMEINPGDITAHGQRGLIYLNLGDMNKALPNMNTAITLQPQAGANYLNRSLVYKSLGNKKAAKQDAIRARELGMQVPEEYLKELN